MFKVDLKYYKKNIYRGGVAIVRAPSPWVCPWYMADLDTSHPQHNWTTGTTSRGDRTGQDRLNSLTNFKNTKKAFLFLAGGGLISCSNFINTKKSLFGGWGKWVNLNSFFMLKKNTYLSLYQQNYLYSFELLFKKYFQTHFFFFFMGAS